jgi:hypothetical protein
METAALTSPQGAVVRGIVGQRETYRAYRAYRALFCGNPRLLRMGKRPGSRLFFGPLGDLVRLVRLVRTKLQPATGATDDKAEGDSSMGERLLDRRLKSQESPLLAPACMLAMHD